MKQILQNLRSGVIEVAEVPCPLVRPGYLLVQTRRSLISPGTERSLVEFSRAGLIGKARSQPEKVRAVLDKIRTDGLMATMEVVFDRLDEPLPLGYCNVGRVVECGPGVERFCVGDRVVSNGPHAQFVSVPVTLAAKAPEDVSDDAASFAVLGAVALNGIRLLAPTLGETMVVVGLGVLGQLAVQLLKAHGCRVIGVDVNASRCARARRYCAEVICPEAGTGPVESVADLCAGGGADGVLITASAKNDSIMHEAASMCRRRGRIVLVGVVDLNLRRVDFYEKELSFQVACSYGPGRYDDAYEQRAQDYPLPYVRWTAARNFEAVLEAMASASVDVTPLISRRVPHEEGPKAYERLLEDGTAMGVLLEYPEAEASRDTIVRIGGGATDANAPTRGTEATPAVGVIGAGRFAKLVLLPALKAAGAPVKAIASSGPVHGAHAARKFDSEQATTDYQTVLADPDVDAVVIATPHHLHARQVCEALRAGKHVFVEKPLALTAQDLEMVNDARRAAPDRVLMAGFNRRFSPHAVKLAQLLRGRTAPAAIVITVNAGGVPRDHWQHHPLIGGGRIVGEACHFLDLAQFLVGAAITSVRAVMLGRGGAGTTEDVATISLTFADGSIASIHYFANGPRSFPKERVEVFSQGRAAVIENWRRLYTYGWPGSPRLRTRQDKGHRAEIDAFIRAIRTGGEPVMPFTQIERVTHASFAALRAAREHCVVRLVGEGFDDAPSAQNFSP